MQLQEFSPLHTSHKTDIAVSPRPRVLYIIYNVIIHKDTTSVRDGTFGVPETHSGASAFPLWSIGLSSMERWTMLHYALTDAPRGVPEHSTSCCPSRHVVLPFTARRVWLHGTPRFSAGTQEGAEKRSFTLKKTINRAIICYFRNIFLTLPANCQRTSFRARNHRQQQVIYN